MNKQEKLTTLFSLVLHKYEAGVISDIRTFISNEQQKQYALKKIQKQINKLERRFNKIIKDVKGEHLTDHEEIKKKFIHSSEMAS